MKLTTLSGGLWLAFGSLWLLLSGMAVFRWTGRQSIIRSYYDSMALAGSELGPQLLLIALAVSASLLASGALATPSGQVGAALTLLSVGLLSIAIGRGWADGARFEAALQQSFGAEYRQAILPERARLLREQLSWRDWIRPLDFDEQGIETMADIAYGEHGERNRLDLLRSAEPAAAGAPPRPVLIEMHGGGYMWGGKNMAGKPLMHLLARRGWIVVTLNYRLVPAARWPAPLVDAKKAVAWIREHIAEYGGDPGFIVATGASAGGNLSALLALTAGQPRYQPGFESADTRIQAAVPFYAGLAADRLDPDDLLGRHLYNHVLPPESRDDPKVQADLYPSTHIGADAAPFFVLTGTHDALARVEDTRLFVERLRASSQAPVAYAEAYGANHGFDDAHSIRAGLAANAVQRFLELLYSDHLRRARGKTP
ncbi:alpha/beta hydrolase [Roseateles violae]|uniref:Alpha/beta hydrolase n=1 Tax=Roseateles violae TaxID=3058042 RepID=A0ABT8E072_9BURK|nr:alpha/beta hydrolase [Pelomonas sp. PFR6]MDN3923209.1 alpha/beta hydrolase [Pelomonas sp. PFR6]